MSSGMLTTREILGIIKLAKEPDVTDKIRELVEKINGDRLELREIDELDVKMVKRLKKKQKAIEKARLRLQTIDPEDIALIAENYEARKYFSPEGVRNLYFAICHQAVHDYKQTTRYLGNKRNGTLKEREEAEILREDAKRFFGDPFFKNITKTNDPEKTEQAVIRQMRREAAKKFNMIKR